MKRLWMEESDGERWLINPALIVANPRQKRRRKKMAVRRRSRRNRMPAGLRRYWAKHRRRASPNRRRRRRSMSNPRRRRARRNYLSPGMVAAMNPRRRRRHARRNRIHHHRRHHARRNPSLMGFTLPPTMDIVGVASGLIVPPMLANYIFNNYVAGTSMGTSKWAYLGVEALSVAATGMAVRKFINVRAGNMMLLGGAARFVLDAVQVLMPSLIPTSVMPAGLSGMGAQPFLGFYEQRPRARGIPSPGLGRYYTPGHATSSQGSRMIMGTPDRLDPSARF